MSSIMLVALCSSLRGTPGMDGGVALPSSPPHTGRAAPSAGGAMAGFPSTRLTQECVFLTHEQKSILVWGNFPSILAGLKSFFLASY